MRAWDELSPDERFSLVEEIAVPGQSLVMRARALYERIRRQQPPAERRLFEAALRDDDSAIITAAEALRRPVRNSR